MICFFCVINSILIHFTTISSRLHFLVLLFWSFLRKERMYYYNSKSDVPLDDPIFMLHRLRSRLTVTPSSLPATSVSLAHIISSLSYYVLHREACRPKGYKFIYIFRFGFTTPSPRTTWDLVHTTKMEGNPGISVEQTAPKRSKRRKQRRRNFGRASPTSVLFLLVRCSCLVPMAMDLE